MPTSKTQICNMALGHIGVAGRIQNVDSENSAEAAACRLYFDQCRDVLLEMQEWSFANRQVALQDLGTPRDGWSFRYKYPNFCALALRIVNPYVRTPAKDQKIPFKVVDLNDAYGKAILTDQEDAILEYNHKVEDVGLFTPTFVQALSLLIASHIAMPLRVDASILRAVQQQFGVWATEAGNQTLRESQEDSERPSEFESIRG